MTSTLILPRFLWFVPLHLSLTQKNFEAFALRPLMMIPVQIALITLPAAATDVDGPAPHIFSVRLERQAAIMPDMPKFCRIAL